MLIAEVGVAAGVALSVLNALVALPLDALPLAAGPTVDFDKTVLAQAALFLVLIWALKPLLFDPLLKVFEEREKRTDGARAEARELEERAGELLLQYQREHEKVIQVIGQERDRLRGETSRLETEIVTEARDRALRIVEQGKQSVAREVQKLRAELEFRNAALAKDVASAVLGREVQ